MIHRTGYLTNEEGGERYIQIETVLVFYQQKFISSGKHLLFEDNTFIGHITVNSSGLTIKGLSSLSLKEKKEISTYIRNYQAPIQENCAAQFGFGLQLEDNIAYCEVLIENEIYNILFDGVKVAKINQNEQLNWVQSQKKLLSVLTLKEITDRIEKHYCSF